MFVYVENVLCLIYDNEEQVFNKFVTEITTAFLAWLFGREPVPRDPFSCMRHAYLQRISAAALARNTSASPRLCRSLQSERLADDQDCIRGPATL